MGSFGKAAVFSFYATKVLCTGEGGMVVTGDRRIAETAEDLRDYAGRATYRPRFNYRLTDLAAAIGLEQLRKLDVFVARRRAIAAIYSELLANEDALVLPDPRQNEDSIYYRYVVKVPAERRDAIRGVLAETGIECGRGVLHPLHELMPEAAPSPCPAAADFARRSLSLPIYSGMTDEEVDCLIASVSDIARDYAR